MNDNTNPLNDIKDSTKDYINLKINEYKLKGVNSLSILTNKMIYILLAIMLGGVILQLLGLSLSFFIGSLLNSTALGFLIVAVFFILMLLILYLCRGKLFMNKLVQLYIRIFFDNNEK